VCWDVKDTDQDGKVNPYEARGQGFAQVYPGLTPDQQKAAAANLGLLSGPLDPNFQKAFKDAFTDQITTTQSDLAQVQEDKAAKIAEIATCTSKAGANDPSCDGFDKAQAEKDRDRLNAEEKKLQEEIKNLSTTQKALNPFAVDCDKSDCNQAQRDQYCKDNPAADRCKPSNNNDNKYNGNGNGSNGNSSFGNGANGLPFGQQQQSMLPTSPLTGGPCTQGYVCVNNTLYNQAPGNYALTSTNPIIAQQQCQVQPMQQCQYGCQPPYGAQQQTGAQSMMGGISQGLGIISSVMKLFGGGGAQQQSIMPAQNVSNACATQPQNPYGTGANGQPCTQPQPPQPDPAQCTSGMWKPTSAQQNGCVTGYQCVPNGSSAGGAPTATLSCQPKVADVGMTIGFSFSCGNSTASAGAGFDTNGALSGTSTAIASAPSGATTATYTLTCVNLGVTASSQCTVQVGKASIVLVASPKKVHSGENSTIGWITAGMTSCVVSSPDQSDFTSRNAGITSVNGAATTSPITKTSVFYLNCDTIGGSSKQASTTIELL
jgi:hypothetical protein